MYVKCKQNKKKKQHICAEKILQFILVLIRTNVFQIKGILKDLIQFLIIFKMPISITKLFF